MITISLSSKKKKVLLTGSAPPARWFDNWGSDVLQRSFHTIQTHIFFFLPRNQSNKHLPLLLKIISSPNSSRNKTLLMYLSGIDTSFNKI